MEDFPSNSHKHKAKATEAPREKLKPVTSAETVRRKQGLGQKFKQTFFSGSSRGAAEHAVTDVIVPSIKDMMYNALQDGLSFWFWGDRSSGGRRPRSSSITNSNVGTHMAYESIMKPTTATQNHEPSRQARARHDFSGLIIPTKYAAEEVLDNMYEIMSRNGVVTVAHLYELTGIRPDHIDNKWGWTNLKGTRTVRRGDGQYLLNLPEPEAVG